MGSGRGQQGSSTLDQTARRRAQARKTAQTLNIEQQAQSNVRGSTPPAQVPKGEDTPADESTPDERMAAATARFFQQVKRPGQVPVQGPPARVTAPRAREGMVSERAKAQGAGGFSAAQQFYRLSGRMPTPRDLAVYSEVLRLEGQLGRRPTRVELRAALARPNLIGPAAPSAVEA